MSRSADSGREIDPLKLAGLSTKGCGLHFWEAGEKRNEGSGADGNRRGSPLQDERPRARSRSLASRHPPRRDFGTSYRSHPARFSISQHNVFSKRKGCGAHDRNCEELLRAALRFARFPKSSQRFQGRTNSASLRSSSRLSSGYSSADEKHTVAICRSPLVAATSI